MRGNRFVSLQVENSCGHDVTISVWADASGQPDSERASALPRHILPAGDVTIVENVLAAPPGSPGAQLLVRLDDGSWRSVPVAASGVALSDMVESGIPRAYAGSAYETRAGDRSPDGEAPTPTGTTKERARPSPLRRKIRDLRQ